MSDYYNCRHKRTWIVAGGGGGVMNSDEMIPGKIYIIDGHAWGKCAGCGKVIRVDGWFGGLHLCA